MKLKFLLILALFACQGIFGYAKATESVTHLIVWGQDDSQIGYFSLVDKPIVTYDNGYLIMTLGNGDRVEWGSAQVKKFTLGKEDDLPTSVSDVKKSTGDLKKEGEILEFKSFTPGSTVIIYSVNGQQMVNETIGSNGDLQVSISSYPSGVYIVKTESLTCKIIKK